MHQSRNLGRWIYPELHAAAVPFLKPSAIQSSMPQATQNPSLKLRYQGRPTLRHRYPFLPQHHADRPYRRPTPLYSHVLTIEPHFPIIIITTFRERKKMSLSALLAPLTLPLASLFAIPMLSSWSTSLNLVFLSLTWTTIAMTYSPLELELFGPLLLRTALYIVPSLLFLAVDLGVPSLAVEMKAQRERGLPGRQKGGTRKIRNVVLWSCGNVLLGVVLQGGIEFLVTDVLRMRSLLVIKGSRWSLNHLPNPWKLAKHLGVGIVSRNVRLPLVLSFFLLRWFV